MTAWLKRCPDIDADLVLSAVLTHHLKINMKEFAAYRGRRYSLRLLADHSDFPKLIREVALRVGLPEKPPELPPSPFWAFKDRRGVLPSGANDLAGNCEKVKVAGCGPLSWRSAKKTSGGRTPPHVVGGTGGPDRRRRRRSGLPRVGEDMRPWIEETFDYVTVFATKRSCVTKSSKSALKKSNVRGTPFSGTNFRTSVKRCRRGACCWHLAAAAKRSPPGGGSRRSAEPPRPRPGAACPFPLPDESDGERRLSRLRLMGARSRVDARYQRV